MGTHWRCFVTSDGACQCLGSDDLKPPVGATPSTSPCVPQNGGLCGYDSSVDDCYCPGPGVSTQLPGRFDRSPPDCRKRPADAVVKRCPAGTSAPPTASVSACDGDCHYEACTGDAQDEFDVSGCYKRQWACEGNTCSTIPR